jgi:gas vesicle protein
MTKKKRPRTLGMDVLALAVLLGVLAGGGCGKTDESTHEPAFLLVQSSAGFEYDGSRLTVHGTSPTTIFFSDRPDRIAGHMPLEKAYEWGRSGDDSFLADPPNATLSILERGEEGNVVVTMSNGIVDGDTISFDVKVLEGELPPRGGPNTLFIDVIGRPLTPLSFAGVRRRTRRRSLAVGVMVGASVGAASANAAGQSASASQAASDAADSADQAADAANQAASAAQDAADAASSANSPSIEQQLSDLKDMLDKGLITQQDYDAKKKELLGEM